MAVCIAQAGSAFAQEPLVRIVRPQPTSDQSMSCCAEEPVFGLLSKDEPVLNLAITDHYKRWKERYISPVFCPVDICHGSCRDYDDACLLSGSQPVLNYFGLSGLTLNQFVLRGCGGACSQTQGQSGLPVETKLKAVESGGSCCH